MLAETNFYEATRNYINKITGEFRISDVTDDTKTQIKSKQLTRIKIFNIISFRSIFSHEFLSNIRFYLRRDDDIMQSHKFG